MGRAMPLCLAAEERTTLVMVTHDIGMKAYAHRVVRMVDGKVGDGRRNPSFVPLAVLFCGGPNP
jgi:ABC-type lipoprotein export system ATPase subunit